MTLVTRLWSRVIADPHSECWVWIGYRDAFGYGQIGIGGRKLEFTHRLAWQLANGPIPAGLLVLHTCDNPPCVRPSHLFLGTHADNTADMMAKGRHRCVPLRGEQNGHARLTGDQVEDIRRFYTGGGISQRRLARLFCVVQGTIGHILHGRTW